MQQIWENIPAMRFTSDSNLQVASRGSSVSISETHLILQKLILSPAVDLFQRQMLLISQDQNLVIAICRLSRRATFNVLLLQTRNLIHPSVLNHSTGGIVGFYNAETWEMTSFIFEVASKYYELQRPAFYSELCLTSRPNGFSHQVLRTLSVNRNSPVLKSERCVPTAEPSSTNQLLTLLRKFRL